jgi:tRNA (guanine37-N1)-methyltransferase
LTAGFADREIGQLNKPAASEAFQLTLQEVVERNGLDVTEAVVKLDYSHTSTIEALKRLLPEGIEVPSSFEQIGHIAHLNLKEEHLPFKYIIGTVILDKNPKIKTVINKVGTIDNEWRVFSMELLAGEENTVAEVKQHGARFRLDFRKVYWNSRLEAEHLRLVERWFKPGDVIADAMAGVGPFTVPAAKFRGCTILANDLNPDSYKWLKVNIGINKVESLVSSFNLDGREFLRLIASREFSVGKLGAEESQPEGPAVKHIIMNLPATAVEFLDALRGSFDLDMWRNDELPMVHVYAFVRAPVESVDHLQARIEKALGCNLDFAPEFHQVRDVAPNKHMYCASFRVPKKAAFVTGTKRQKTDSSRAST